MVFMPRPARVLACALLCAACAARARAQEAASLGTVTVSAARAESAAEDLPGDVSVITASDLQKLPGETLDEKLASVAGAVAFRQNGAYSFSATVSLRGLGASEQGRTLVLLDGIPLNTAATGAVNWNRISLEDVERVEVIKGPSSLFYGSNAEGGLINIVTRKPGDANAAALQGRYGTYNTYALGGRAQAKTGKFYAQASASHEKSDGYVSAPEASRTAYTTARNLRESGAGLRAGYRLSENSSLDASYSYYDGLRGEGTKILAPDGLSRRIRTHYGQASWKASTDKLRWDLNAYYQNERYGRVSESMTGAAYKRIDTDGHRVDKGVLASLSVKTAQWLTLTPGLDFKHGAVDMTDTYLTAPYSDIHDRGKLLLYAPFLQAQAKAFDDRLTALAGMRYDGASFRDGYYYNPTNPGWDALNGDLPSHDWHKLSPKISAAWQYSAKAAQYASYGQGFRAPNLEDLCLTLQRGSRVTEANPDLGPETVATWETGLRLNPLPGVSLEPSAYYTTGRDFMYEVNTGRTVNINGVKPIYKKQNVAQVEIYGAELAARAELGGGFSLNGSYAHSRSAITDFPQSPALVGRSLTYAPEDVAFLGGGWENAGKPGLSGGWRWQGGQYFDDANTQAGPAWSTLSAKAWLALADAKLSLALENILDQRYQESQTDLAPGRTLTASLTVDF